MAKKIRNPEHGEPRKRPPYGELREAASYLTKPARHRDRKHDYQRNEKPRIRKPEDETASWFRARRIAEKLASQSEDWYADYEGELDSSDWLEPDEKSPTTSEVQ